MNLKILIYSSEKEKKTLPIDLDNKVINRIKFSFFLLLLLLIEKRFGKTFQVDFSFSLNKPTKKIFKVNLEFFFLIKQIANEF
jgi:hypothetical protein